MFFHLVNSVTIHLSWKRWNYPNLPFTHTLYIELLPVSWNKDRNSLLYVTATTWCKDSHFISVFRFFGGGGGEARKNKQTQNLIFCYHSLSTTFQFSNCFKQNGSTTIKDLGWHWRLLDVSDFAFICSHSLAGVFLSLLEQTFIHLQLFV